MSLEEAVAANTAAIKELTAAIKAGGGAPGKAPAKDSPAEAAIQAEATRKTAAAGKTGTKLNADTFRQAFVGYLDVEDKAVRKERQEQVGKINQHFGVAKITEVAESQWTEALKLLKAFKDGTDPFAGEDEGDEGESLV